MQLSRLERYMIANQLRILELLEKDRDAAASHAKNREAFECGYERHYDEAMMHIYEEIISEDAAKEIWNILDMFNELQYAYDPLTDKSGIDANRVRFYGLDANTETTYLSYAQYLCSDKEHFPRIKRNDERWNSHAPFLPMYRAMLPEWRKSGETHALTKEDIIRITSVKYPERY